MPEPSHKITLQPINNQSSGLKRSKKRARISPILLICGAVVAIIIGALVSAFLWYNVQLGAVGNKNSPMQKITIVSGSASSQVGKLLEGKSIIRSSVVFDIYVRLSGKNNELKAGTYRLSPGETLPQIVGHLVNGSVDTFSVTFYPGATLVDNVTKDKTKKQDVTTVLENAGYSDDEITTALGQTYTSPLFTGKPASADLEGYVYGETYNFNAGATVHEILQRTFDEFYNKIQSNNLIAGFTSHDLSLYQAITLASIIQREDSDSSTQKQVAQVFYSRLSSGMVLGSDVTYQYIADKTGLVRSPNLDSPYNTRRYPGLTPGPIAVPGLSALEAVAHPANGDYLYFLSGDDGTMYFAKTDAEHEANIAAHCKVKCSTP
ncbi:MAG: endolytic transglycosylase MltG [Candidatus Saccharibacteria bacterium]